MTAAVGSNLAAVAVRGASLFGDHPAVICDGVTLSYAELDHRVRAAATELVDAGLRAGARVVTMSPNCIESMVLSFATAYAGGVSVPLNAMLQAGEIAPLLARVEPSMVFAHPAYASRLADAGAQVLDILGSDGAFAAGLVGAARAEPFTTADAPAAIVFTSGSSSAPKGCVKSHHNYLWAAANHQMSFPRTPDDRELYAIPLAGIGFANLVMGPMLGGATIVLDRFSPASTLDLMERCGTTTTFLPATMLDSLLAEEARFGERDLSTMRRVQTSYSMSDRLRRRIAARFPGRVHYSYGLTEGSMSSAREPHRFLDDPTCVGHPCGIDAFSVVDAEGRHVAVGETGEIVVAGPDVMLGYLDDRDATAQALRDGWLHTGDLGHLDATGALHFVGRLKDMIKSGGVNIASAEVEQYLMNHEAVHDASVVGVPDDHWGEVVVAFVEAEDGTAPTADELGAFCRDGLAGFKQPKRIVVVDVLPRNPGGKIVKDKLRAMAAEPQFACAQEGHS